MSTHPKLFTFRIETNVDFIAKTSLNLKNFIKWLDLSGKQRICTTRKVGLSCISWFIIPTTNNNKINTFQSDVQTEAEMDLWIYVTDFSSFPVTFPWPGSHLSVCLLLCSPACRSDADGIRGELNINSVKTGCQCKRTFPETALCIKQVVFIKLFQLKTEFLFKEALTYRPKPRESRRVPPQSLDILFLVLSFIHKI